MRSTAERTEVVKSVVAHTVTRSHRAWRASMKLPLALRARALILRLALALLSPRSRKPSPAASARPCSERRRGKRRAFSWLSFRLRGAKARAARASLAAIACRNSRCSSRKRRMLAEPWSAVPRDGEGAESSAEGHAECIEEFAWSIASVARSICSISRIAV